MISEVLRFIVLLGFFSLMMATYRRYQIYPEPPIRALIFLSVVGCISIIVELVLGTPDQYDTILFLQYLLVYGVFRLVFVFSILFYFEYHEHDRPTLVSIIIAAITIIGSALPAVVYLRLHQVGALSSTELGPIVVFVAIPIGLGIIYSLGKILYLGYGYLKVAVNPRQRWQLLLFLSGNLLMFGIANFSLSVSAWNFTTNPQLVAFALNVILPITLVFGLFLILISLSLSSQVMIPGINYVDNIIVINEGGIPLYSYKFSVSINTEEALLSGGISAITSLLKESIGVESMVRRLIFKEKEILIKSKKRLGFILISDHITSYMEEALSQFSELYLTHVTENTSGKLEDPENITPLLLDAFGLFEGYERLEDTS